MTVRELLEHVDSQELSEWQAYYNLEPFGQERADVGAAIVAATVANTSRGPDTNPYQVADFMPVFDSPAMDDRPEWEIQLEQVRMWNELFGGAEV